MVQQFSSANFYKDIKSNNPVEKIKSASIKNDKAQNLAVSETVYGKDSLIPYNLANVVPIRTQLEGEQEKQMYSEILAALKGSNFSISPQDNMQISKKLDALLKSGKLLSSSSNDDSTTLKNLYDILKTQRCLGFDNVKILTVRL